MPPAHHDVVRREFARQAGGFGHRGSLFVARSIAEWIDEGARLASGDLVRRRDAGLTPNLHVPGRSAVPFRH